METFKNILNELEFYITSVVKSNDGTQYYYVKSSMSNDYIISFNSSSSPIEISLIEGDDIINGKVILGRIPINEVGEKYREKLSIRTKKENEMLRALEMIVSKLKEK